MRARERVARMFALGGDFLDMMEAKRGERKVFKPEHFRLEELLPEAFFNDHHPKYGEILWGMFDPRALQTLDALRKRFGPMIVNSWLWGGPREFSGYRPPDCREGATLSQHRFGRAFDVIFQDVAPAEVRKELFDADRAGRLHEAPHFRQIACVEDFPGMSWFHFDTRNHNVAELGVKVVGP